MHIELFVNVAFEGHIYGWDIYGNTVTEWMSLQIKYVNLYYLLFNSLYNQVIWN